VAAFTRTVSLAELSVMSAMSTSSSSGPITSSRARAR